MAYRILTLDGGGCWALIEIRALIELYGPQARGHDVLRRFDMVAANSGGSIVLAGLVENRTLADLLALFHNDATRHAIFSPSKAVGGRALNWLAGIGPKYSAAAKLPALQAVMPTSGTKPLNTVAAAIKGAGGLPVHLLIIGFDYDSNGATFFRSAATNGYGYGAPATIALAAAVHASTNAPVNYFDAPADLIGYLNRYWDGAVTGNNNPALAACVEAVNLGHLPADLRILSLGTATTRLPVAPPGAPASPYLLARGQSSVLNDLRKLATAILDDPPDFATFVVHSLTGAGAGLPPGAQSRIVRLNPLISPVPDGRGWTAPPGCTREQFEYICNLDMDAIEPEEVAAIDNWCTLWIAGSVRNQPIRMNGETLAAEIGDDRFADAVRAWHALVPPAPPAAGPPIS